MGTLEVVSISGQSLRRRVIGGQEIRELPPATPAPDFTILPKRVKEKVKVK